MRITIQHKQTIYQIQRAYTEHKVHLMFGVLINNGGISFGAKRHGKQNHPNFPLETCDCETNVLRTGGATLPITSK